MRYCSPWIGGIIDFAHKRIYFGNEQKVGYTGDAKSKIRREVQSNNEAVFAFTTTKVA